MVNFQKEHYSYEDMLAIMRILRAPGGCPWDAEQTHESIRRNFLEETCEAVEAIDNHDMPALCEELGDVLYQIMIHSEIEKEKGEFGIDDVVDGICRKMVRRHPRVFGGEDGKKALSWEEIKALERKSGK